MFVRALVLSSLAAAPAWAEAWIVIGGGGRAPSDGAIALTEARDAMQTRGLAAEGYPRRVISDDVPGLKAGFHLAVLGACASEREAFHARDVLRKEMPGVYVRRVGGDLPLACPAPSAASSGNSRSGTCLSASSLPPGAATRWEIAALEEGCEPEGAAPVSLRVRLVVDGVSGEAVAFELGRGTRELDGELIALRTRTARVVEVLERQPLPVLIVAETHEPDGEHGRTRYEAFVACGSEVRRHLLFDCGSGAASSCGLASAMDGELLRVTGTAAGEVVSASASLRCVPGDAPR